MSKTKLQKIQSYLESSVIKELPVTYNRLEYVEPEDITVSVRLIQNTSYSTRFSLSTGHHKPISKCLNRVDG